MQHILIVFLLTTLFFQAPAQTIVDSTLLQKNQTFRLVDSSQLHLTTEDVFIFSEVMPKFQGGGDDAFNKYILKNLVISSDIKRMTIQGTLFIRYIIETDGSVSNVEVYPNKGLHPSLDQAVVNVIKNSPRWEPGLNQGKPVRVKKIARIKFTN